MVKTEGCQHDQFGDSSNPTLEQSILHRLHCFGAEAKTLKARTSLLPIAQGLQQYNAEERQNLPLKISPASPEPPTADRFDTLRVLVYLA